MMLPQLAEGLNEIRRRRRREEVGSVRPFDQSAGAASFVTREPFVARLAAHVVSLAHDREIIGRAKHVRDELHPLMTRGHFTPRHGHLPVPVHCRVLPISSDYSVTHVPGPYPSAA